MGIRSMITGMDNGCPIRIYSRFLGEYDYQANIRTHIKDWAPCCVSVTLLLLF